MGPVFVLDAITAKGARRAVEEANRGALLAELYVFLDHHAAPCRWIGRPRKRRDAEPMRLDGQRDRPAGVVIADHRPAAPQSPQPSTTKKIGLIYVVAYPAPSKNALHRGVIPGAGPMQIISALEEQERRVTTIDHDHRVT